MRATQTLWLATAACLIALPQVAGAATPTPGPLRVVVHEDYESLPLGSDVPNWLPIPGSRDHTLPWVQNISVGSGAQGAVIQNDWELKRDFGEDLYGLVVIEMWLDPKVGSDTNCFVRFVFGDATTGSYAFIAKNDSDRWMYNNPALGIPVFFAPVDGTGRRVRAEFNTATNSFSMFFDSNANGTFDASDFSAIDVPGLPYQAGLPITGISMNSGRGLRGQPSYFDDLLVGVIESNSPPDMTGATATPGTIWPPNNKMVDVAIEGIVDPDGDPITVTILAIADNETNDPSDHDGIGTDSAAVRAEREGRGDGREYIILFEASDGVNPAVTDSVTVTVTHDQRSGRAKALGSDASWAEVKSSIPR